jgi:hypothetical protein
MDRRGLSSGGRAGDIHRSRRGEGKAPRTEQRPFAADLAGATKGVATKSVDDFLRDRSWVGTVIFFRMGRLAWAYYDTGKQARAFG